MVERVRVLIIGGGAVGCSCLYHFAQLGWSDVLLVERNELTSGSTWHAAGNCPTFSTGWGILKLQQYSAALYRRLSAAAEYPINYHVTGSVRLAHTTERMDEYQYVRGLAEANGLNYEILSPAQLRERHPLVALEGLHGALWDPNDGDIDPAQLTQALAAAARARGARVQRFTQVTGLEQLPAGDWRVRTDRGDYLAEVVVNAAGYRAGEVMALLGQALPIVTMSHQYLVTEAVPELAGRSARVPLLRDPDVSYYLRQEGGGFILGPYEQQATAMWLAGIPEDFSYRLWDDALERLEPYIEAAFARVPPLARAGVKRVVNGPIPYSPDGLPYVGPAYGLANFYHCNTFSFGIAQAGGAGKALAEWVVNGGPEWDLWSIDPRRFTGYASTTYTLAKAIETYQNEYAPAYPCEERPAGRPLRTSPLHERLQHAGAHFGVRGGWERALWYDGEGSVPATLSFRRDRNWMPHVAAEVRAVRTAVGLMDLPGFTKFMIGGPGAQDYLDRLVCSRLPAPGRIALAYALTEQGGILSEFTLTRLAPETFYAVSAAIAEHHDDDVLRRGLPRDGSVRIERVSESLGTLVLAGPRAREVLQQVTAADLSNGAFPWLTARRITVATAAVIALRVNYVGELGWELHVHGQDLAGVYDALVEAGARCGMRHFGMYAMDSLRIDKCYRGWKSDLETGYTPFEACLDRFVDLSKGDFIGKAALMHEKARGTARRLVPLLLDEPGDADAPYCSGIFAGARRVGLATSGLWSHTLERSVVLAYLDAQYATEGTALSVDILGRRCAATVAREPLFDPGNARPRG
ncbi:MAG: FAD-dependent oxidoreductase [Proteobacteria bacterium]|nr:FAD-dependent oxidoreductase [Pseudomonadota bacterium]